MTRFELDGGGDAEVLNHDGHHVRVSASRPSPPGSTLAGSHAGERYLIKVRGCKLEPASGRYVVEGRFVNLSRNARELLDQGQ